MFVYELQPMGRPMFHETTFHLMRVVMQEHSARWAERLPDLTKPQYAVLKALAGTDGLDQTAVGEASATTKGTLTEMLNRMQARGLIDRRSDADDARRRLVLLTQEGNCKLLEARVVADALEQEMLGGLSEADRMQFTQTLTCLRNAAKGTSANV
jgi:DNA-binding MarR family transcriptional regulator